MKAVWMTAGLIALSGCAAEKTPGAADTGIAAVGDTGAGMATEDPDRNVAGSGVPAGLTARTDRPDAAITGAKFVQRGGTVEVTTGPAHILYAGKDTAKGIYSVSATVEQLEKPVHPEAYGIFIGGRDLNMPTQTYTYFLVRGSGELMVKVREGDKTRDVVKWTESADVPREDASGKATYAMGASVTGDAVKFMINGKQVASVSKVGVPTDGVAGLRINHNLHLKASPISIRNP